MGRNSPNNNGRTLRADEVEEELDSQPPRCSIRYNFDITEINKAGFNLEYVAPHVHGESSITHIEL